MNEWAVLNSLREIAVLEDDTAEVLPLCRSALESVVSRLRRDTDPADSRIIRAAAGLAYYKWALRQSNSEDGVVYFKAGDVTIRCSRAALLETAETVRREALLEALPLLEDDGFLFCSV